MRARDVRRTCAATVCRMTRPRPVVPVAVVSAAGLVAAFALAQGTGVRWLGGVVLLLTAVWCLLVAVPRAGWVRALAVVAVAGAVFVASHVVAGAVGAWPAVLGAAAVLGATAWWLVDRARPRVV